MLLDLTCDCKLGSLRRDGFERCASTGSGLFAFFGSGFAHILEQIVSLRVKEPPTNTSLVVPRYIKREKSSLLIDVCCSKMSLLKLPLPEIVSCKVPVSLK